MDTSIYVTLQGLEKLNKELSELLKKRPKIVQAVQITRELGDLSENAGYQSSREELTMLDRRISEIQEILKVAKVNKISSKTIVEVGTKVTLKDSKKTLYVYDIVGVSEADPIKNKISYESPIGKAIYKKKVGDTAVVETPLGNTTFEIINLE